MPDPAPTPPQIPNVFIPTNVPVNKIDEAMAAMGIHYEKSRVTMAKEMALGFIDTIANLLGLNQGEKRHVQETILFQFLDMLVHQSGLNNDNILQYWLPRWVKNAAANFATIDAELPDRNFEALALKYDGQTAVIPSTGPSLDRNIDELKKIDRSKYVLISPTSSLNPLIANGFTPDFACMNDAQPWINSWHFKGIEDDLVDIPLIMMTTAHPTTLKAWPGPKYYYNDFHPKYDFLAKRIFEIYDVMGLPCSGCVSNVAIRMAVTMGVNKVALLGNDFAKTGGKYGCTKYERKGDDWKPVETRKEIKNLVNKRAKVILVSCPNKHPVKDARQKKCFDCAEKLERLETTGEYLFYFRDMLALVQSAPQAKVKVGDREHTRNVRIWNCTGGGVARDINPGKLSEVFKG